MKGPPKKRIIRQIYRKLFEAYGRQHWWPARTPFEVMIGTILTQNTAWTNAARAIARLKEKHLLKPSKLDGASQSQLARLIRSSGYFNQKAHRLKILAAYFQNRFGSRIRQMRRVPLIHLRKQLLGLHGIGPETADSILLYALDKPIFVVDAYTKRILARHSLIPWDSSYEEVQKLFMETLPRRVGLYNEYHALIVNLGKSLCLRRRPQCHCCPLRKVGRLRLETDQA